MRDRTTRRNFLARAGRAAGSVCALGGMTARSMAAVGGANERIGLALIGCGRRGGRLLELLLRRDDVALPAVCDVDGTRVERASERVVRSGRPRPNRVDDYRTLLERDDVDGVVIATPDHWHAVQLLHACLTRKDAYVETPVGHTVEEGLGLARAVRKYHRVVQVGLQQRSGPWFAEAVEQIRAGRLGRIAQTRSWTFAKVDPIAPQADTAPPASLDYDRWLGPAPDRPFNPGRVPGHFDNWWDYGGGVITRFNPHLQDVVNRAMRVNVPRSVTVTGGNFGLNDFRETPDTLEAVFEYETKHYGLAGTFLHVYSLRLTNGHAGWGPPIPRHNGRLNPATSMHWGTQFFGHDATLFVDRTGSSVFPTAAEQTETLTPTPTEPADGPDALTTAHLDNFVTCMRTRSEPRAPIEAGHFAALPCHLANIAYRTGSKLHYDSRQNKCFLDPEHQLPAERANDLLGRTYRAPYLPPQY